MIGFPFLFWLFDFFVLQTQTHTIDIENTRLTHTYTQNNKHLGDGARKRRTVDEHTLRTVEKAIRPRTEIEHTVEDCVFYTLLPRHYYQPASRLRQRV